MGFLDTIARLFSPPPDKEQAGDESRAEVESHVDKAREVRHEADKKIASWQRRTDQAIRAYKPGLIDPLQEARENLGRPIERGR